MDSNKNAPASGLQTVVDVIVAPQAAFERLRTQPAWGWAFLISIVLGTIGAFLTSPAIVHAMQASWPALMAQNPRTAALSPAQQQQSLQIVLAFTRYAWIFTIVFIPFAILVTAVLMLIFNAIGRGAASFGTLWAAAANVAVPSLGIGYLVLGIIVLVRGADSFQSTEAVSGALPSLALLAPGAGVKLYAFLAAFNVFNIWGVALVYVAMRTLARVAAVHAILTALILLFVPALLAAAGAR
jgi:hypothetical protein